MQGLKIHLIKSYDHYPMRRKYRVYAIIPKRIENIHLRPREEHQQLKDLVTYILKDVYLDRVILESALLFPSKYSGYSVEFAADLEENRPAFKIRVFRRGEQVFYHNYKDHFPFSNIELTNKKQLPFVIKIQGYVAFFKSSLQTGIGYASKMHSQLFTDKFENLPDLIANADYAHMKSTITAAPIIEKWVYRSYFEGLRHKLNVLCQIVHEPIANVSDGLARENYLVAKASLKKFLEPVSIFMQNQVGLNDDTLLTYTLLQELFASTFSVTAKSLQNFLITHKLPDRLPSMVHNASKILAQHAAFHDYIHSIAAQGGDPLAGHRNAPWTAASDLSFHNILTQSLMPHIKKKTARFFNPSNFPPQNFYPLCQPEKERCLLFENENALIRVIREQGRAEKKIIHLQLKSQEKGPVPSLLPLIVLPQAPLQANEKHKPLVKIGPVFPVCFYYQVYDPVAALATLYIVMLTGERRGIPIEVAKEHSPKPLVFNWAAQNFALWVLKDNPNLFGHGGIGREACFQSFGFHHNFIIPLKLITKWVHKAGYKKEHHERYHEERHGHESLPKLELLSERTGALRLKQHPRFMMICTHSEIRKPIIMLRFPWKRGFKSFGNNIAVEWEITGSASNKVLNLYFGKIKPRLLRHEK